MKFTNKVTGVTISLDEKAAGRLGPEWGPAKSAPARRPAPKQAAEKKSEQSDED